MFISKKDLSDLKSKAGAASQLQSQIAKLTNDLNAHKSSMGAKLKEINEQIDLEEPTATEVSLFGYGFSTNWLKSFYRARTLKTVIKSIESRLDQQEKMQKMLFAHLGIEYAKTTEETVTGKQKKEVLRKIKKQTK